MQWVWTAFRLIQVRHAEACAHADDYRRDCNHRHESNVGDRDISGGDGRGLTSVFDGGLFAIASPHLASGLVLR